MRIACVSVVGLDFDPLLVRVYNDGLALDAMDVVEADRPEASVLLRYHHIVYSALDLVEERHKQPGQVAPLANPPAQASSPLTMYLGYLCPVEEFHVYGYATSTHVKIIVLVEEHLSLGTSQPELQGLLSQTHGLYANALQNPFTPIGARITSPNFLTKLDKLVETFNSKTLK